MSLNSKQMLIPVAKQLARDLRKSSTPAEKIFWEVVRNRKFLNKKFYRQHPFFFDYLGKETFFIADFYCHEKLLVVEIDGGYHLRQKDYDELRTSVINLLKIKVIRFTNDQITNDLKNVLRELDNIINGNSP
jgi:very-short-patch-repair endonuclease